MRTMQEEEKPKDITHKKTKNTQHNNRNEKFPVSYCMKKDKMTE